MIRTLLVASCLSAPVVLVAEAWAQRGGNNGIDDALAQPLHDLGLLRREPEEVLERAADAPYADGTTLANGALDCERVATEIASLDAVLGQDVDVETPRRSLMARARTGAGNAIVDAVEDLVELPYRSIIRRITGAERRDREIREARQAGMVRRAFLKGLSARECATPQMLVVIVRPVEVTLTAATAADVPLSDLELAHRQLAAANASAFGRSAPPQTFASSEIEPAGFVEVSAAAQHMSDLELARRQLFAANAAPNAAMRGDVVVNVAGRRPPIAAPTPAVFAGYTSDLELARGQLMSANAAAVNWTLPAPPAAEVAPETSVTPGETPVSELELARRQLFASSAPHSPGGRGSPGE